MLSPSVTRTLLSHLGDDETADRRRLAAQRLTSLTPLTTGTALHG